MKEWKDFSKVIPERNPDNLYRYKKVLGDGKYIIGCFMYNLNAMRFELMEFNQTRNFIRYSKKGFYWM